MWMSGLTKKRYSWWNTVQSESSACACVCVCQVCKSGCVTFGVVRGCIHNERVFFPKPSQLNKNWGQDDIGPQGDG